MSELVLFFSCAYNAEKTLRRAIDSILDQTYENWVYYILDNGSTDGTGDIICEYEKRDSRIHGLSVPVNDRSNLLYTPFRKNNLLPDIEYDWLATLDSDDEYVPQFAEKCLIYAHENGLDLVCVSSDLNKSQKLYFVSENKIFFSSSDYEDFPSWYKLYLPVWGKLYHRNVIENMRRERVNFFDCEVVLEAVFCCKKMGALSEILHHYSGSGIAKNDLPESESFFNYFIETSNAIYIVGKRFFQEKCGSLTKRSEDILLYISCAGAQYTLNLTFDQESKFWKGRKRECVRKIMQSDFMRELLSKKDYGYEMNEPEILLRSRLALLESIASKLCGSEELDNILIPLLSNMINEEI